ncbi:type IV pilus modification protein PilV [Herbaspirillum sp. NPDC087042]|uniref:type IV pilus modification protein PilV n=1 Tax=Herbaspirillum sp. NPDC087042 TaxID=3364004 RepID=UPI00380CA37B
MRAPSSASSSSSGFSMIEVLIAMLVIGTGALAMVMLQLHALRSSHESGLHARATLLAQELAELRASYPLRDGGDDPTLFAIQAGKAPMVAADCTRAPCSAHDFATAAVADWGSRFLRDFPAARAVACHDGSATAHTAWRCDHDASAAVVLKLGWRRIGTTRPDNGPVMSLVLGP